MFKNSQTLNESGQYSFKATFSKDYISQDRNTSITCVNTLTLVFWQWFKSHERIGHAWFTRHTPHTTPHILSADIL